MTIKFIKDVVFKDQKEDSVKIKKRKKCLQQEL